MKNYILPALAILAILGLWLSPKFLPNNKPPEKEIIIASERAVEPPEAIIFLEPITADVTTKEQPVIQSNELKGEIIFDEETVTEEPNPGISEEETESESIIFAEEESGISEVIPVEREDSGQDLIYLGTWVATGYCQCEECCGGWAGGPTASGAWPSSGHTVACDALPFGTRILVNGTEYVVEDLGVHGEWIDIFFNTHEEALAWGMRDVDVYLIG